GGALRRASAEEASHIGQFFAENSSAPTADALAQDNAMMTRSTLFLDMAMLRCSQHSDSLNRTLAAQGWDPPHASFDKLRVRAFLGTAAAARPTTHMSLTRMDAPMQRRFNHSQ